MHVIPPEVSIGRILCTPLPTRSRRASTTTTHCPWKGDASYYSVVPAAADGENAVWTYEQPYDAVADIREHVAFYPNKVSIEIITD